MNLFKKHSLLSLALVTFILLCLLIAVVLTRIHDYHSSDFGYYWVGSRMMLEGQDPYDPSQWIPFAQSYGSNTDFVISFAYPLPMILLFMPLAAMDLLQAAVIWVFLMSIMVFSSIILLLRRFEKDRLIHIIPPLVIGILLYRPIISTFYHGQLTSLIFCVLTFSAFLIYRRKWVAGAAILSLILIKPQVGLPIMGLVGLWFLLQRQWNALLAEAISTLVFLTPAFLYQPNWVGHWLSSGRNSLDVIFSQAPTLWGLGMLACQGRLMCGLPLAIALALSALTIGVLLILRFRNEDAFSVYGIIVCTVLLITPYLQPNDLIYLLLPFLTAIRKLHKLNFPYLGIATATILLALLSFGLVPQFLRLQSDAPSSLVTIFVLAVIVFALGRSKPFQREQPVQDALIAPGV